MHRFLNDLKDNRPFVCQIIKEHVSSISHYTKLNHTDGVTYCRIAHVSISVEEKYVCVVSQCQWKSIVSNFKALLHTTYKGFWLVLSILIVNKGYRFEYFFNYLCIYRLKHAQPRQVALGGGGRERRLDPILSLNKHFTWITYKKWINNESPWFWERLEIKEKGRKLSVKFYKYFMPV